ncbi:uncharacterized protein LOC112345737 isoform X1 [Selaginella moellendorffii]|uniref:uncharacterized protein LOC112345737 isoform X1 n=2 Tax=Selaginella moellendorffii TaxID=88036 RepID=UPI000D1C70D9|nr:uncharacterized protein LOC112345737 isoform X1 [Selaginella moellendorffii]|eukprot:XP_024528800.1 uncharacterized protein LOC112345737 isoform X1 [Selaginella moellendorffii]
MRSFQTYSDQACWHAQKAMELCDPRRGGESSSNLLVLALLGLAKGLLQKGDLNCINYLQRALVVNQDLHGEEDVSNAAIHEAYGDYYIYQGESRDGGPARKSPQPRDESGVVMSVIDYERNEFEKAIEEYHKARELVQNDTDGPPVPAEEQPPKLSLASIFTKIARTRGKQTRHEDAVECYQKALAIYTSCAFPNEPAIAQLNYELGFTYHKVKKYEEALKVLKKAAQFCEQQHDTGGEHPLTLQVMKQQGITLYDMGDLQPALQTFEELVQMQRTQHGGGSVIVAETLKYLGDVSIAMKSPGEACSYYNRALKILRKRLGSHDETVRQLVSYIKQLNLESGGGGGGGGGGTQRLQEAYRPAGPAIPEGPE